MRISFVKVTILPLLKSWNFHFIIPIIIIIIIEEDSDSSGFSFFTIQSQVGEKCFIVQSFCV